MKPLFSATLSEILVLQGVGMVLPIEASMAHRPHFDLTLSATVTAITTLYVGFGVVRALPPAGARDQVLSGSERAV